MCIFKLHYHVRCMAPTTIILQNDQFLHIQIKYSNVEIKLIILVHFRY